MAGIFLREGNQTVSREAGEGGSEGKKLARIVPFGPALSHLRFFWEEAGQGASAQPPSPQSSSGLLVVLAVMVRVVMAFMVDILRCLGLRREQRGTKGRQGQN